MELGLRNKVALIAGASRGIGAASAKALAKSLRGEAGRCSHAQT